MTTKVYRVATRYARTSAGKLKRRALRTVSSEVVVHELKISSGKLELQGTAKFLRYTNEIKKPLYLDVVDSETAKTIYSIKVDYSSVAGHIVPIKKSAFRVTVPLENLLQSLGNASKKISFNLRFQAGVTRNYRLYIPTRYLSNGFMDEYFIQDSVLLYPYRTSYGNLSLLIVTKEDFDQLRTFPNLLTGFSLEGSQANMMGWLDRNFLKFFDIDTSSLFLTIKRRGSETHYSAEVHVEEEQWSSTVEVTDLDFSKGVWDLYFASSHNPTALYRMKLEKSDVLGELRRFSVPTEKESLEGVFYRTKQNGFSINLKPQLLTGTFVELQNKNGIVHFQAAFAAQTVLKFSKELPTDFQLSLIQRDTNIETSVPLSVEPSVEENKVTLKGSVDYRQLLPELDTTKKIWDAYLQFSTEDQVVRIRVKVKSKEITQTSKQSYFHEDSMYSMYFYSTIYGRLSLAYTLVPIHRTVTSYRFDQLDLIMNGRATLDAIEFTGGAKQTLYIVAKNRMTEEEIRFPCQLVKPSWWKKFGLGQPKTNSFEARVSLVELQSLIIHSKEILDFYIEITSELVTRREKIGLQRYSYYKDDVLATTELRSKYEEVDISYCLTITPRGNLKLETFKLDFSMRELLQKRHDTYDIWLIGERPDTAQDTGYHLFKYCRLNYPNQPVYYAIEQDSKDLKNIEHLGNVLLAGSKEHFEIASKAKVLIGSHDFDYFLPFKGIQSPSYKDTVKVFLQHGVLGRKKVEYDKKYYKYPFDIFCVSSTYEQQMVMDQQGYTEQDVRVTGLSRFDQLMKDHAPKREILLIPTWREWLNTTDALVESEYLKRYVGLLQNPRLHQLLLDNNLKLNFYPHYRMQQFFEEFGEELHPSVELIKLGEKNVQDLLKENALMITDFSSVSFDFTYLSKPVIYYHFDRDSFFKGGIMRPFDETFLGDIASQEEELIDFISASIDTGFKEKEEVAHKKNLLFDYVDQHNCERVYKEIIRVIEEKKNA